MTKFPVLLSIPHGGEGIPPEVKDRIIVSKEDIFEDIDPNPTIQSVDNAVEIFKKENCDGVIAIGGWSPIDAGKCIGALVNNPGSAFEYLGVDLLKNDGNEIRELIEEVVVPETWFFRNKVPFKAFISFVQDELLPRRKKNKPIRILSISF